MPKVNRLKIHQSPTVKRTISHGPITNVATLNGMDFRHLDFRACDCSSYDSRPSNCWTFDRPPKFYRPHNHQPKYNGNRPRRYPADTIVSYNLECRTNVFNLNQILADTSGFIVQSINPKVRHYSSAPDFIERGLLSSLGDSR